MAGIDVLLAACLGTLFGFLICFLFAAAYHRCLVRALSQRQHTASIARRPKRLILVRHAESEGNVDSNKYATVPDNKISLTRPGHKQALKGGEKLKQIIGDETVEWFVSPYTRTTQTFLGLIKSFGFNRNKLPGMLNMCSQIREQDFGNFQNPAQMKESMEERARFGRFWYRFPGGESGADVFDRVESFISMLFRTMKEPSVRRSYQAENYVLVTHGLTMRLFLMRYLNWSVQVCLPCVTINKHTHYFLRNG
jgi:broad specificity phosphatase PhoE